jgi:hypothetical protein
MMASPDRPYRFVIPGLVPGIYRAACNHDGPRPSAPRGRNSPLSDVVDSRDKPENDGRAHFPFIPALAPRVTIPPP